MGARAVSGHIGVFPQVVYAVIDDALSARLPARWRGSRPSCDARTTERFIVEVRRDDPEAAARCESKSANSGQLT